MNFKDLITLFIFKKPLNFYYTLYINMGGILNTKTG